MRSFFIWGRAPKTFHIALQNLSQLGSWNHLTPGSIFGAQCEGDGGASMWRFVLFFLGGKVNSHSIHGTGKCGKWKCLCWVNARMWNFFFVSGGSHPYHPYLLIWITWMAYFWGMEGRLLSMKPCNVRDKLGTRENCFAGLTAGFCGIELFILW